MLVFPTGKEERAGVATWCPTPCPSTNRLQGRLAAKLPKLWNCQVFLSHMFLSVICDGTYRRKQR